ncbi:hypothetical protein ACFPK9_13370 [Rubritalea spongiae]|uniref:Uncharacterized protein n=1 Tax=Rubritalea spongiae TaxID=430797 RepID=A0ABW5E1U5_9BACT
MRDHSKVFLHASAQTQLPATGQRRDILMRKLRKIQISPDAGADFLWSSSKSTKPIKVTVCVGYAISWIADKNNLRILDIRPIPA